MIPATQSACARSDQKSSYAFARRTSPWDVAVFARYTGRPPGNEYKLLPLVALAGLSTPPSLRGVPTMRPPWARFGVNQRHISIGLIPWGRSIKTV